jgi:glutathione synthase/RimK-type ligase-like ATP-grasp enzyme
MVYSKFTKPVKILIIDNNSPFVLPLVRSFSGYSMIKLDILLATRQKPNHFIYSRFVRKVYTEEPITEENFGSLVKKYIKLSSADIIITTRESISKLIYQHRHELEKIVKIQPVSDVKTLDTLYNKWELNCWLKKNNYPFSLALPLNNEIVINDILNIFSFPLLLKPLSGTG